MVKEFNLMEAASELTGSEGEGSSEGANGNAAQNADASSGQSSSEEPAKSETSNSELTPEDALKAALEDKGKEKEDLSGLLDGINKLGAIHNGMPIKVDSPETLKELLQKGFDYTKKTMALAEEGRVKQEEFAKLENEWKQKSEAIAKQEAQLQTTIQENRIMESIVTKMQTDDPELFEHIKKLYQAEVREFERHSPLISKYENELSEIKKQIGEVKGLKAKEELDGIKKGWEKELSETQLKVAPALLKLGVKVDWNKIKEAWAADAQGKLSVEQALYSVYGKEIVGASQSQNKLLATKNKTQEKLLGRTAIGSGHQGSETTVKTKRAGDYEDILRQASEQF
jgi:hypothetical protein